MLFKAFLKLELTGTVKSITFLKETLAEGAIAFKVEKNSINIETEFT